MGDGADDAYEAAMREVEEGEAWWDNEDKTAWVLPAERRLRLYRRIARSARGVPGAQGMRRQALLVRARGQSRTTEGELMYPRPLDEIVEAVTLIGTRWMDEVPWDKEQGDGRGCSECNHFNPSTEGLRPPYRCPVRMERCECRPVPPR